MHALRREGEGQLVERRQVVVAAGDDGEAHRQLFGRADRVQPEAEELPPLRGAVAAVVMPAHLLVPPRPGPAANRQRHTVN